MSVDKLVELEERILILEEHAGLKEAPTVFGCKVPDCEYEGDSEWGLLCHVFKAHKEWIRFEAPQDPSIVVEGKSVIVPVTEEALVSLKPSQKSFWDREIPWFRIAMAGIVLAIVALVLMAVLI